MFRSPDDHNISVMWIDPGVTTGICVYNRKGRNDPIFFEETGLAETLRVIEASSCFLSDVGSVIGYESFYISDRTTKTEAANREAALDIIGWLRGQKALGRIHPELVHQAPSERTPKTITPKVVERCLGSAPTGHRHAMDAARHVVRYLVSDVRHPVIRARYADV